MSGTSMDGIDIALIETDGESKIKRGANMSVPYEPVFRDRLAKAIEDAAEITDAGQRPGILSAVERELTFHHADAVRDFLIGRHLIARDISILGFHGQTVLHRPEKKLTVQLGQGDILAKRTGIETAFDFRRQDVEAGGEGAPLVPIYHQALVEAAGLQLPVAVVNLGGVGNVTYIGADKKILAFDTGPGNALIDDWVMGLTGEPMDKDGTIAAKGMPVEHVLRDLLDNPYFSRTPPKSLDRNEFSLAHLEDLSLENGARTLAAFTALSLEKAGQHFPEPPKAWIISGGGAKNPTLMAELENHLDGKVIKAQNVTNAKSQDESSNSNCCNVQSAMSGWSAEFMEAEAFAYLAVRVKRGLPITFPTTTGVSKPMTGGRIATI